MADKSSLAYCIDCILKGPWKFIQLRGNTLSDEDINRGDVDLLGSDDSIDALISETFRWVRAGHCHIHISSRKPRKKMLIIYSLDGRSKLVLDLWSSIPQIIGSNCSVTFAGLCSATERSGSRSSLYRLPLSLEACLYLHHLSAKGKDLKSEHVRRRLEAYAKQVDDDRIVKVIDSTLKQERVEASVLELALSLLRKEDLLGKQDHVRRIYPAHLKCRSGGELLCVMGCDGVGKTSLSAEIGDALTPPAKQFKGKHLYRKSLVYKFTVIFFRPFLFQSREGYDESIAVFVYLRACLGLWSKRLFHKERVMLIDRNVVDFLMLKRKTDRPRWSIFLFLTSFFGNRIPAVHCVADFETVAARKLEITKKGHSAYDKMLFKHFAHRVPTEYTLYNNSGELAESKKAFLNIIQSEEYPLRAKS